MQASVIYQDIKQEGRAEGRAEGEAVKTRELALKMLENGIDVARVAAITGLSDEQISTLRAGQ